MCTPGLHSGGESALKHVNCDPTERQGGEDDCGNTEDQPATMRIEEAKAQSCDAQSPGYPRPIGQFPVGQEKVRRSFDEGVTPRFVEADVDSRPGKRYCRKGDDA